MKTRALHVVAILACLWPATLQKGTFVEGGIKEGIFSENGCTETLPADSFLWTECYCVADLKYPVVSGLDDPGFERSLNQELLKMMQREKCEGKPGTQPGGGVPTQLGSDYEVLWQDDNLLSLKLTHSTFTGRGQYWEDSIIVDLKKHKILSTSDMIAPERQPEFMRYLRILAEHDEELRVDLPPEVFVKGECYCQLRLDKEGFAILFSPAYPQGGLFSVPIPLEFITYPAIKDAIKRTYPG